MESLKVLKAGHWLSQCNFRESSLLPSIRVSPKKSSTFPPPPTQKHKGNLKNKTHPQKPTKNVKYVGLRRNKKNGFWAPPTKSTTLQAVDNGTWINSSLTALQQVFRVKFYMLEISKGGVFKGGDTGNVWYVFFFFCFGDPMILTNFNKEKCLKLWMSAWKKDRYFEICLIYMIYVHISFCGMLNVSTFFCNR